MDRRPSAFGVCGRPAKRTMLGSGRRISLFVAAMIEQARWRRTLRSHRAGGASLASDVGSPSAG